MNLADKILSRCIPEPNSGCWLWLGARNGDYGVVHIDRIEYAHRTSFQIFVRSLHVDELACHKCDMPLCVNPEHLFAGTYKDNHHDAMAKGRWSHGERHGMAKLTECQVISIRELYAEGARSDDIADAYDMHASHIRKIVSGKLWKHTLGDKISNRRQDIILSKEKAEEIRALKGCDTPRKIITQRYGITLPTLYAIWSGRQWKS